MTSDLHAALFLSFLVRGILASGKTFQSSSKPVTLDVTGPIFMSLVYMDVHRKQDSQPITHQSSNSTIRAMWNFVDKESQIMASPRCYCTANACYQA